MARCLSDARQRDTAVPEEPSAGVQPVASIAPDGLEAFARDLRALRAKANLEYPEMAETSHYEMKTLAAAAGGLRMPTLPVAVAFVRACDGNGPMRTRNHFPRPGTFASITYALCPRARS